MKFTKKKSKFMNYHICICLINLTCCTNRWKNEGKYLIYPICKKGSGWQSTGLVWGGWKGKLLFPAADVELHILSIGLRLDPSASSWKWSFEERNNKQNKLG